MSKDSSLQRYFLLWRLLSGHVCVCPCLLSTQLFKVQVNLSWWLAVWSQEVASVKGGLWAVVCGSSGGIRHQGKRNKLQKKKIGWGQRLNMVILTHIHKCYTRMKGYLAAYVIWNMVSDSQKKSIQQKLKSNKEFLFSHAPTAKTKLLFFPHLVQAKDAKHVSYTIINIKYAHTFFSRLFDCLVFSC